MVRLITGHSGHALSKVVGKLGEGFLATDCYVVEDFCRPRLS